MAAKAVMTERQQQVLQAMVVSRSCARGLAHRAEISLLAFDGLKNEEIAQQLGCERHGIGTWRRRWQDAFERLTVIECVEKPPAVRAAIEAVLGDLPRAGCGGTFTAEQIARILAVTCEPPGKSGRPVTHWTPRELTEEVLKRGIVTSISVRQVGRFLKGCNRSGSRGKQRFQGKRSWGALPAFARRFSPFGYAIATSGHVR
ncbi:helix-turn-helix domain-containing protein [Gemmata obscuriglobus]|uniref:helix-turn-helix domain-containing protein n=1 Tax=Gemmata obscuriglobus TaxID=114 RepID=UPI001E30B3FF|nr:helix-turn-helix domain-containing protein [Gemmata obscuriglobus]